MSRLVRFVSISTPSPNEDSPPAQGIDRLRLFILHLLILSAAVTAAIVTVFTLPAAAADAPKIFTPTQWQAIDDKRVALEVEAGFGSDDGVARPMRFASYQAQPGPIGANPGQGRSPGVTYPRFGCIPEVCDTMNVFFGGVGSKEDVVYDMTNGSYGNTRVAADVYPTEDHAEWQKRPCGRGPDFKATFGAEEGSFDEQLFTRAIYIDRPLECPRVEDARTFHIRLWGGVPSDTSEGEWSIGAAHWDNRDHQNSSRFEEAEALGVGRADVRERHQSHRNSAMVRRGHLGLRRGQRQSEHELRCGQRSVPGHSARPTL